jgi:hypothetical protein
MASGFTEGPLDLNGCLSGPLDDRSRPAPGTATTNGAEPSEPGTYRLQVFWPACRRGWRLRLG